MDEYAPSLPAMVRDFESPVSAMRLSITAFLFPLGVGQVIMGPLSDRYFSLTYGLVPIVSPVPGGCIQDPCGWRANFGFMFAFTALAFVFIVAELPETQPPTENNALHPARILKNFVKVLREPRYISLRHGPTVPRQLRST